jgi:glycosyltransferase involved in cell wall biosynthesis
LSVAGKAAPVLHVISGLGGGGAEAQLVQIASALQQSGIPQHVASLTGRGIYGAALDAAGVDVTFLDLRGTTGLFGGLARLVGLARRLQPRAVQGWMYHGDLAATLAHRLARLGPRVPLYWGLRCSDMDLAHYSMQLRAVVRACVLLSGAPDLVVANARRGLEAHVHRGYQPRATLVIPNAVDVDRFAPDAGRRTAMRTRFGFAQGETVFALVARVDPMKDHAGFLDVLSQHPKLRGLLVGAGTEALDLPTNVVALGRREDVSEILAAADAIVLCSAFGEGFSNALVEGMAAGLPPIATDVGDARTIVGQTGWIVPPRDRAALGAAMRAFAAESAEARVARGNAARAHIVDGFSAATAVASYRKLYGAP